MNCNKCNQPLTTQNYLLQNGIYYCNGSNSSCYDNNTSIIKTPIEGVIQPLQQINVCTGRILSGSVEDILNSLKSERSGP